MTTRIIGPTGSRKRRRFLFVPVLMVALLAVFWVAGAQAVHDEDFELEGNQAVDAGGPAFDWTSFFSAASQESPVLPDASRPGFTSSGFAKDFDRTTSGGYATFDKSTYATGSKDTLSISPGWQCNRDNNVNDKIDIVNAYAVTYTDPDTKEEILYFALERFANDGDANVGVWFLQGDVTCVSEGGSVPFSGNHQDGDLLIVSEFSNGGDVSTIQAYRWTGDDNTGGLDPQAVAEGVDCKDSLGGDSICATVNDATNGVLNPPWDTENKRGGGDNKISEFFEGGINLTQENLGGRCFNTFIADTRSSTSLTATLFDFALGKLGACGLTMSTTPSQTTRQVGSTAAVTDLATVSGTSSGGTAPTPTGTVSFFLCGPSDLTPANTGTCEGTSGSQVGSAVTVAESAPGTATARSADAQSLIDEGIGKYCFRATFTAAANDPNYAGQTAPTSNPAQECFTVTDVASTRTEQSWLPQDTAIVTSSGGSAIAGSVTWSLYETSDCTGTARTLGPVTVDASGRATTNNTIYQTTAKTISWRAVFTSSNSVGSGLAAPCETMTVSVLDNDGP